MGKKFILSIIFFISLSYCVIVVILVLLTVAIHQIETRGIDGEYKLSWANAGVKLHSHVHFVMFGIKKQLGFISI